LRDFYIQAIRETVEFYSTQGEKWSSSEPFFTRINMELDAILKAIGENKKIFIPYHVFQHGSEDFFQHFGDIQFAPLDTANGFHQNFKVGPDKKVMSGYVYSSFGFSLHTHHTVVMNSVAVMHNKPHIEKYLEARGFRDVTVERRTNEHNGRQNVWMVRAVKAVKKQRLMEYLYVTVQRLYI
jgi:hypothetical protein